MSVSSPFRLYSEAEIEKILSAYEILITEWSEQWFNRIPDAIKWNTPNKKTAEKLLPILKSIDTQVAIQSLNGCVAFSESGVDFFELLFGFVIKNANGVGSDQLFVAKKALAALAFLNDSSSAASNVNQIGVHGAGWGLIELKFSNAVIYLLLSPAAINKIVPMKKPVSKNGIGLVAREKVIKNLEITLTAEIGSVEIPLFEFRSLAPGDILKLDQTVESKVKCKNSLNKLVFEGYLGKKNQQKAILVD